MPSNIKQIKNKTISFTLFGKEIFFYLPDTQDHIQKIIGQENSFYELNMLEDIYVRVRHGTTIIDVGANIGNHTIFFAKICNLKVFALEPLKHCFEILNHNIKLNKLEDSVTAFQMAAGRKAGKGNVIVVDPKNYGLTQFERNPTGEIELIALDELILDTEVSAIKIDVEGMEFDVLQGAKKLIKRFNPIIYVEAKRPEDFKRINSFLSRFGYSAVVDFNWTPTILFMPNRDTEQRFEILGTKIDYLKKEINEEKESINSSVKQQGEWIEERIKKFGAKLDNHLVENKKFQRKLESGIDHIQNQTKQRSDKTEGHINKLGEKLYNRLFKLEKQNNLTISQVDNRLKELTNKVENHFLEVGKLAKGGNEQIEKLERDIEDLQLQVKQQGEATQDHIQKIEDNFDTKFLKVKQHWIWTEERIKKLGGSLDDQLQKVNQHLIWTEERVKKISGDRMNNLPKQLKNAQNYAHLLENSIRFQIGNAFVEIIHHPLSGTIKFPYRILRISSNYLRKYVRSKNLIYH